MTCKSIHNVLVPYDTSDNVKIVLIFIDRLTRILLNNFRELNKNDTCYFMNASNIRLLKLCLLQHKNDTLVFI